MREIIYILTSSVIVCSTVVGGFSFNSQLRFNSQFPFRVGLAPDCVASFDTQIDWRARCFETTKVTQSCTTSGGSPTLNGRCTSNAPRTVDPAFEWRDAVPDLDLAAIERSRVLRAADRYLKEKPITITASLSPRSAGGRHDFFSQGDYWWPDPKNPDGPYVQRDGMSNPDNFVEHRRALMRLSIQVPALAAAWMLTGKRAYADKCVDHVRAWFVNPDTRMNPNLQYSQAVHGTSTGRSTGVIDTIHLVEVARAIEVLEDSGILRRSDIVGIKKWFSDYLVWLTTSKFGIEERDRTNNHATCWVMQVAAFAHLTGDQELLNFARERFKKVIVPNQIEKDGSFPQELRRTKPYGYTLFNLEALSTIAQILSTAKDDLWKYQTPDGRGLSAAMNYAYPFIKDKRSWPKPPDVMYFDEWPMRQSSLLFGGLALGRREYIETWKKLPADSAVEEVIRNFFIRQPVLWVGKSAKKV